MPILTILDIKSRKIKFGILSLNRDQVPLSHVWMNVYNSDLLI